MKSYNFNNELAKHLLGQLENHFWAVATLTRQQIIDELGSEPACENCECDGISYNNTDAVTEKLVDILLAMRTATVAETYGNLVPQFLCISGKMLAFHAQKAKESNGNSSSESVPEQGSKKKSGR